MWEDFDEYVIDLKRPDGLRELVDDYQNDMVNKTAYSAPEIHNEMIQEM